MLHDVRKESCVHTVISRVKAAQSSKVPIRVRHHEFPAIYPTTLARDAKQLRGKSVNGAIWNRAQFHYGHVSLDSRPTSAKC
jgi:hypothetical protein